MVAPSTLFLESINCLNENALKKAKSYQDDMAMSESAIRDQLTSSAGEQFTAEQAGYAMQHLHDN